MTASSLIVGTIIFLICAVLIVIVFAVFKGPSTSQGSSTIAVILLIVSIIIIISAFIAYYTGVFNKYKGDVDNLKLKYDYLTYYEPVNIISSATNDISSNNASFDSIATEFEELYTLAVANLIKNKTRAEVALSNARLQHDTKVLLNYDFSVPCLKLAEFIKKNDMIIRANDESAIRLMLNSLSSLGVDSSSYYFNIYEGTQKVDQVHITVVIAVYIRFYEQYPTDAQICIRNGICLGWGS